MTDEAAAVLGIVAELPTRYNPDGLSASVGEKRAGLAGWIIDRWLGKNAEPDEETVRLAIVYLCERELIWITDLCKRELIWITDMRRLAATGADAQLWQALK